LGVFQNFLALTCLSGFEKLVFVRKSGSASLSQISPVTFAGGKQVSVLALLFFNQKERL
jgi:hypothetical protein